MFNSILVVCTGNICRSPIGERYLQKLLPNKIVASAGTGALVGHEADETALKISQQNGLSLLGHVGKQFNVELGCQFDLILAMERKHIEYICQIAPQLRGKTMLYGYWVNNLEIPDPYRKSEEAFSSVYKLIEQAANCWADKLGN